MLKWKMIFHVGYQALVLVPYSRFIAEEQYIEGSQSDMVADKQLWGFDDYAPE